MDRRLPGDEDGLAPDRRLTLVAPAERRALAGVALLTLVPFALLAAWARLLSPAAWEPDVLLALALEADLGGDATRALNRLGDLPVWAVLVALASVFAYVVRGLLAGVLVGLSMASDLAAAIVKIIVERERPPDAVVEQLLGYESFAFPSGHVVRAVALVAIVGWLFVPVRWRLPAALAAAASAGVAMGFARVALGVHWPTDALGGLLLGLGWFALTVRTVADRAA